MVSLEATRRKYHGKTAEGYRAKRQRQQRWRLENEAVTVMLREERQMNNWKRDSVLDVPCGEGRFLSLYRDLRLLTVLGVDASEDMLRLAARRGWLACELENGDATSLRQQDGSFDFVVCVRFLDLIPEAAMRQVVRELCRVARRAVILTIRVGNAYVPKSNTATHDGLKFRAHVRRQGWRVAQAVPIFKQGWHVLKLVPI